MGYEPQGRIGLLIFVMQKVVLHLLDLSDQLNLHHHSEDAEVGLILLSPKAAMDVQAKGLANISCTTNNSRDSRTLLHIVRHHPPLLLGFERVIDKVIGHLLHVTSRPREAGKSIEMMRRVKPFTITPSQESMWMPAW